MKWPVGTSNGVMQETTGSGRAGPRLLAAAIEGSEQAFDSLFGPLVEPGYRLALVMLRNPHEAEDAIQEAVFSAWRHLRRLRDEDALRAWFLSIGTNF
jgi:RNA polymerase sigma-70 factor (ECF subfamily)